MRTVPYPYTEREGAAGVREWNSSARCITFRSLLSPLHCLPSVLTQQPPNLIWKNIIWWLQRKSWRANRHTTVAHQSTTDASSSSLSSPLFHSSPPIVIHANLCHHYSLFNFRLPFPASNIKFQWARLVSRCCQQHKRYLKTSLVSRAAVEIKWSQSVDGNERSKNYPITKDSRRAESHWVQTIGIIFYWGARKSKSRAVFFHHWSLVNRSFNWNGYFFNPIANHSDLKEIESEGGGWKGKRIKTSTMSQQSFKSIERNWGINPVVTHRFPLEYSRRGERVRGERERREGRLTWTSEIVWTDSNGRAWGQNLMC